MSSKNASFVVKCHCVPIFKLCHHHQQDLNLTKVIQFLQANNNKRKNSNSNNDSSSRILSLYYKNKWMVYPSIYRLCNILYQLSNVNSNQWEVHCSLIINTFWWYRVGERECIVIQLSTLIDIKEPKKQKQPISILLLILSTQHMVTCRDKTKLTLIVLLQLSVMSSKTGEYIHIQIFLKCNNNTSALIQLLLNHANINRKYNLIFLLNHIYYHQQRVCLLFAPAQSTAKYSKRNTIYSKIQTKCLSKQ